jgi:NDP-sugar pyrophosphorylase family protein
VHHIIEGLAAHGVRDLVLNLHHRPETITRTIGDGSDLGVRVRYSWEQPILGSAGGPRLALPIIAASPFFIVNGDTLTNLDLGALWDAHRASGALVTMAVIPNPRPEHYGGVIVDAAHRIVRFARAGEVAVSHHFIGVQVVAASVFETLAAGEHAESVNQIYPALMARTPGAVRAFVSDASFEDVGTPRDYLETVLRAARRSGAPIAVGRGTCVDPSASVAESVLWDDVVVGPGCRLTRCIVADGVRLPAGSTFDDASIVAIDGQIAAVGHSNSKQL